MISNNGNNNNNVVSFTYRKESNGHSQIPLEHEEVSEFSTCETNRKKKNEVSSPQLRNMGVQPESCELDSNSTMSAASMALNFRSSQKRSSLQSRRVFSRWSAQDTGFCHEYDDVNLAQVNISGLRAATDTNKKKGRRYLWIFLLSVCFAVMVIQITDRLRHYISEPVSVSVTLARNRSLIYPAITICNKNKFNVSSMRRLSRDNQIGDISDLLSVRNTNSLKLWMLTSHSRRKIINECWFGRNVTCDDRGHWSLSFTTMGVCHTYKLNDSMVHLAGIFHNLYLKVRETEKELYEGDDGWKIYVHDTREDPTLGVQTHGTSLYPGQGRDLRLDMRMVESLHHSRNPCDKTPNYLQNNCFADCFKTRIVQKNVTCRLPYMTDVNLPWCVNSENYRKTEKIVNDLFFFGQWSPNECSCKPQCTKLIFTSSLESTTDRYNTQSSYKTARARVYYQDLQYEYIREEVGYGTIDLLCDVGGTLSLLMGASLLTCCELLEVAWVALMKKCCKSKKKLIKCQSAHHRRIKKKTKRRKTRQNNAKVIAVQSV